MTNNLENFNFDINFSKNTLKYIEKTLFDYKIRILKDIAENLNIQYKDLFQEFLVKKPYIKKYHGKDRTKINDSQCMARVWHSTLGPVQCSRKKIKDDNDIETSFCKIHQKHQNYGKINESFDNLN